jgi:hypothetical protein
VTQRGAPGIQLPVNSPSLSGGVIDIAVSTR